jgi:hypothetical protein
MGHEIHRRPSRTAGRRPLDTQPLTVADADAAGWTRSAQRHAVRVGELQRLQRGVVSYVDNHPPDTPARRILEATNLNRARAAVLQCRRAAISHQSAAIAHGMPSVGELNRSCLTVPSGTALRKLAHVHLHRARMTEPDVVTVDGYRVMAPARTIMDVARERGVDAGVVAADFALHTELVTIRELSEEFEICQRWPGRKAARITLLMCDGDSESPLESLSRLRMAAAGLPGPKLQQELCDIDGRFLGRSDFYWDEFGVVGESDGDAKYAQGDAVLAAQREREGLFEKAGLLVVRWGWSDLFTFDRVVERIEVACKRGARPGSPHRRWGLLLPSTRLHP